MNLKTLLKRNWFKVVLLFLAFAIIVYIASILFSCGLGFKKRTAFLRIMFIVVSLLWAFFTVRGLCIRYDFAGLWRGMVDELYGHQEDFLLRIRREYQELMSDYPLAVAEYETHCWRQNPRPSQFEIIESALAISQEEWIEREKHARQSMYEKNKKQ